MSPKKLGSSLIAKAVRSLDTFSSKNRPDR